MEEVKHHSFLFNWLLPTLTMHLLKLLLARSSMLPRTVLRKDEGRTEVFPHISKMQSFRVTRICRQLNGWALLQTSRKHLSSGSRELKISLSSWAVCSSGLKKKKYAIKQGGTLALWPAGKKWAKLKEEKMLPSASQHVYALVNLQLFHSSA